MLGGKFWKVLKPHWKSTAVVLLNHWGLSEKPSQKHWGLMCDWLFIVQHSCLVAALSFYPVLCSGATPVFSLHGCCTSGDCYSSSSFSSSSQPSYPSPQLYIHQRTQQLYGLSNNWECDAKAVPALRAIHQRRFGLAGNSSFDPFLSHRYFCISAWAGNKRRESHADKHS